MQQLLRRKLHRRGIARMLNSGSNSYDDRGDAYVQTIAPRWLGRRLAVRVVRWTDYTRAEWDTIRIGRVERHGRWTYRWRLHYRRA